MNDLGESPTPRNSLIRRNLITRRIAIYLIAPFVTMGALALILLSPLLLQQLSKVKGVDWARLSDIGQTYGAASAILSAIALIGVTFSLAIQAQQARTERVRITRDRHTELLRIVLDAPELYGPIIGDEAMRSGIDERRFLFCTMWVNYARTGFESGVLTEELLHDDIFGPAFKSEPLRVWWRHARKYWHGGLINGRKDRRFVQIIDEEYRKAEMADSVVAPSVGGSASKVAATKKNKLRTTLTATVLGVVFGIIIGSRLRSDRR